MIKKAFFLFAYLVYANESIDCGDGTIGIMNDDYCDCPADGRDEPMTSACYNGHFICKQPVHEGIFNSVNQLVEKLSSRDQKKMKETLDVIPLQISSSRVLDGFCDCCDGSDENDGWVSCKNRCKEGIKQIQKLVKSVTDDLDKGLSIKKNLLEQAKSKRIQMLKDVTTKRKELEALKKKLQAYEDALTSAKSREEVEFEIKEGVRAETCPEIQSLKDQRKYNEELQEENSSLLKRISELESSNAELKQRYSDLFESYKLIATAESISEFDLNSVASETTTTLDEQAATMSSEPHVTSTPGPNIAESEPPFSARCRAKILGYCVPIMMVPVVKKLGLIESSESIQAKINQYTSKISDTERFIDDIEKNQDYGPDDVWISLDKKCLNINVLEYNYELCFFGSSKQRRIEDGSSVTLGQFSRYGTRNQNEGEEKYFSMLYENGQSCWNGPPRSVEIIFECGPENKIVSVEEPSRCEYTMKAVSPVACTVENDTNTKRQDHSEL